MRTTPMSDMHTHPRPKLACPFERKCKVRMNFIFFFFIHTSAFQLLDKPWSQMSSFLPPGSCLHFFITHRVQQSHRSSIFHRVLQTHALAISASQFVHKKKSQRIYTSVHSAGLELTKLIYTRLEDNLIRHRGDRLQFIRTPTDLTFSSKLVLCNPGPPRPKATPDTVEKTNQHRPYICHFFRFCFLLLPSMSHHNKVGEGAFFT